MQKQNDLAGSVVVAPQERDRQLHAVPDRPWPFLAHEVKGDEETRRKAAQFILNVSVQEDFIDPGRDIAPNVTLQDALDRAREGNEEARQYVGVNVRTAVVEALIKSGGHLSRIEMSRDEFGNWLQHGSALLHVNANALRTKINRRYEGLMDRAEAETVNAHLAQDRAREDLLEDNILVFPSLVPTEDEVSATAIAQAGFFLDTMTASLQFLWTEGDIGIMNSGFVAGVAEKGGVRFDTKVMTAMYELVGYDTTDWGPLQYLQNPLVIPKSLLPNGPSDFIELYYKIAADIAGHVIDDQDFSTLAERSAAREKDFESIIARVTQQLIDKSRGLQDVEASLDLLTELIKPLVVKQAILDDKVDPNVFGAAAAEHIIQARVYYSQGDMARMEQAYNEAEKVAIVKVCGFTKGAQNNGGAMQQNETKKNEQDAEEDEYGSLDFQCTKGHWNHRERGKLLDNCTTCGEDVSCKPKTKTMKFIDKLLKKKSQSSFVIPVGTTR